MYEASINLKQWNDTSGEFIFNLKMKKWYYKNDSSKYFQFTRKQTKEVNYLLNKKKLNIFCERRRKKWNSEKPNLLLK